MNQYGVISIENQQHYGCGGVFAYPYEEDLPESDMPLATYLQYREMLPKIRLFGHQCGRVSGLILLVTPL